MAKGKGFVPFGKGGGKGKPAMGASDNDADDKGKMGAMAPPFGKAKGNPFGKGKKGK